MSAQGLPLSGEPVTGCRLAGGVDFSALTHDQDAAPVRSSPSPQSVFCGNRSNG